jgi:phosphatidylglycerophosphate synthase
MATVHGLKPAFQRLLAPLAAGLAQRNVTANQVTVAAAILSVAYGALIAATAGAAVVLLVLPAVLLVRMALNAIDGMLARRYRQESRLGLFLNEIGDVVSDTALYLPLALVLAPAGPLLAGSLVVAFALTEFAGVLALAAGGKRRYDGPFGKSDRAVFFAVVAVAAALFTWPAWLPVAMLLLALGLALATVANRIRHAMPGESTHG